MQVYILQQMDIINVQIRSGSVDKEELLVLRRSIEQLSGATRFKARTWARRNYFPPVRLVHSPRKRPKTRFKKRLNAPSYHVVQVVWDTINVVLRHHGDRFITPAVVLPIVKSCLKWARERYKSTKRRQVVNIYGPDGKIFKTVEAKRK